MNLPYRIIIRVKIDALTKHSVGICVPSMFLGTRDMAVNRTDEVLALGFIFQEESQQRQKKKKNLKTPNTHNTLRRDT